MPVLEEIMSPELVLVSAAEEAARARQALADYEAEYEQWIAHVRTAFVAGVEEAEVSELRLTLGAFAFTVLASTASAAPLVLLILFR